MQFGTMILLRLAFSACQPHVESLETGYFTHHRTVNTVNIVWHRVLTGWGATHRIRDRSLQMLRQWVSRASDELSKRRMYRELVKILETLFHLLASMHRDNSHTLANRLAGQTTAVQAQIRKANRWQLMQSNDIGLRMLRCIAEDSIRQIRPDSVRQEGDGEYYTKDTYEFRDLISRVCRDPQRSFGNRNIIRQLETPSGIYARVTRNVPAPSLMDTSG